MKTRMLLLVACTASAACAPVTRYQPVAATPDNIALALAASDGTHLQSGFPVCPTTGRGQELHNVEVGEAEICGNPTAWDSALISGMVISPSARQPSGQTVCYPLEEVRYIGVARRSSHLGIFEELDFLDCPLVD